MDELYSFSLYAIVRNAARFSHTVTKSKLCLQCFVVIFFVLQVVKTNQFSVTRHEKVANGLIGDQGLPGVFILYELSPMMVKFTEKHR